MKRRRRAREEKTSVASLSAPSATIKEERKKRNEKRNKNEEQKIMHGERERGSAVCARYTFDASREWKQEDEKKKRSTGGMRQL